MAIDVIEVEVAGPQGAPGSSIGLTQVAVNQWITSPFIRTNVNRALSSNTPGKMFIPFPAGATVNQCAINVTTGVAAATATVVLYADNGTGRASATPLATSSVLDCSTTGVKTGTFSPAAVISAPGVWAAVAFADTSVAISWSDVSGPGVAINTTVASLFHSSALGLPENLNPVLFQYVPRVALRRSA